MCPRNWRSGHTKDPRVSRESWNQRVGGCGWQSDGFVQRVFSEELLGALIALELVILGQQPVDVYLGPA